jgi:hypothetical protein
MRVSLHAAASWRYSIMCLVAMTVCLAVSACGGIPYGSYHYSKLAIGIYEGLPITQAKGFTKAFVSCDPDEKLIGGGFRSDSANTKPVQIVASYPSDYAGNDLSVGVAPTTWTVEGYSATGGGRFSAYAL